MKQMKIKDIFLSMLRSNVEPMTEKEIFEILNQGSEYITKTLFLPTGDGFLTMDEEQTKKEDEKNGL